MNIYLFIADFPVEQTLLPQRQHNSLTEHPDVRHAAADGQVGVQDPIPLDSPPNGGGYQRDACINGKKESELNRSIMARLEFKELLDAGVHFGHLRRKWNPNMAPYIFDEKKGIHIIDLNKTAVKLEEAAAAMKNIARSGKKILFVATKKQAKDIVAEKVKATGMPFVTEGWSGGMLQLRHHPPYHQEDGHHRPHEGRRYVREHVQA